MTRSKFTLAIALLSAISAGPSNAAQTPVLFSQLPDYYGGFGSDTAFYNLSGQAVWQLEADDFRFAAATMICGLRWWGSYGATGIPQTPAQLTPPVVEQMRVRIMEDASGLPGAAQTEWTFDDLQQTATGIRYQVPQRDEYRWEIALPVCFEALPGTTYWLSIVQLGELDSHFRWDTTYNYPGRAYQNMIVGGIWTPDCNIGLAFELTGIPEPASGAVLLIVLGGIGLRSHNWLYSTRSSGA